MEIGEFIAARIAEEKRIAQAADQSEWSLPWPGQPFIQIGDLSGAILTPDNRGVVDPPDVEHMVRQQPRTTLARLDELEALVAAAGSREHRHTHSTGGAWRGGIYGKASTYRSHSRPCDLAKVVLSHIAAIWRHHPDYREEWAP